MRIRNLIGKDVRHLRGIRRWAKAARRAPEMDLDELRETRALARKYLYSMNEVLAVADSRLALPLMGSNAFPKPHGTDWAWRPDLWRRPLPVPGRSAVESKSKLGAELTLFHDCARSELSLRQLRNHREADLAPYGLRMDVFAFDGSFLSLVLDLPHEAVDGLTKGHLLRMSTIVEMEKPLEIFARLNIKHGPNTEQIVRELPLHEDEIMVEFDLAYSNLNEKRIERAWVDIIFENPQMSQVVLRDLTFSRRPRAEF
ncbi:hypothetical protein K1T73_16490 [Roseovarius sp. SCSIO 43702]|uniref:DUF6478 family protein n=1 Tax=Roseovarius sp. SCSIO 43702 TaxID=2823043 RepID=UPI001C72C35E|nr:DUF6478 family protein [Roseovarius sp. SCSIO 43702]QYX56615.1 hypothetical protein K1T73_16490 [Roseovarius sp. SCSIO 43702]